MKKNEQQDLLSMIKSEILCEKSEFWKTCVYHHEFERKDFPYEIRGDIHNCNFLSTVSTFVRSTKLRNQYFPMTNAQSYKIMMDNRPIQSVR